MKGTFPLTEILNLLHGRVPRNTSPQFRLQNFVLGRPDWETSPEASLHIGEQGEIAALEKAMGAERMAPIAEALARRGEEISGGAILFPTRESWRAFARALRGKLGPSITLSVSPA